MSTDFQKYAVRANELVRLVATEIDVPEDQAARIIRSVLHALRNRLSHEESFQLLAQLPLAFKGVYVDGWKFSKDFERIHHLNDFLDEVRKEDRKVADFDFGDDQQASRTVAAVFKSLSYYISEGEFNDIIAVLPKEIKQFIRRTLAGSKTVM